jgi:hypothetical protein
MTEQNSRGLAVPVPVERREIVGKNGGKLYVTAKGERHAGRQKGVQNKFTRQIKDTLTEAIELYGRDGKGKEGTIGFWHMVIEKDLAVFCHLIGRAMPLQVNHKGEGTTIMDITYYESTSEVKEDLRRHGLPDDITIYGDFEVEPQEDTCTDEDSMAENSHEKDFVT